MPCSLEWSIAIKRAFSRVDKKMICGMTNNENASTNRFPVDRINDEAAEDIDPQIPPRVYP